MEHDARAAQREADSEHAVSQEPCMRRSGCCKDESAVTVLDSVYRAFLDTNKNRNQRGTLEDLFKLTRSRGFHYEHLSIPYSNAHVKRDTATENALHQHDQIWT